ncbi:MAG: hypothetical protein XD84_0332 [Desulfotomaculum sp. 46_80]|nr:MAG: hypothetical protein XD84_0332 [Desulfotomaculum sp. 46_80]
MLKDPFNNIPPELWLMLASASGDKAKIQNLLQLPVNWDYLLQLAINHRVYPLVYKTLKHLNNPEVPEYVIDYLQQRYQENAVRALTMTGETVRISKYLKNNGIHAVVLKGAPLSLYLYSDITIRPSRDIDILVAPDELIKAQELLESEGYYPILPECNMTSRQLQIYFMFTHSYHFGYWHSEKNIYLELHWRLGHALPMPKESNIKRIEMSGSLMPVLSDEELLLYLISHGASHAWCRLRWLVDIVKFIQQKDIDWDRFSDLVNSIGMKSILHQTLILANRLFDVPLPTNYLSELTYTKYDWRLACTAMNVCLTVADNESNDKYTKHCWKIYNDLLRVGWKSKLFYFFKYYFSPHMNDIKLISLPNTLFPLYYTIRPFTWLVRSFRKYGVEK